MAKERLYTTKEIMEHFRISRFAITRAINSGKLVVTKKGSRKEGIGNLFSEESIRNYLNSK